MTPEDRLRVLLIDDHPVVREGLRSMLTDDTLSVVGEAATGAEGIELAQALAPDVALLDMQLPDMQGLSVLREIRRTTSCAVLVLSMHDDPVLVRSALDAGASGYLLKGATRQSLVSALHAVRTATVIDPLLARDLAVASPSRSLTALERQVLGHMAQGLTNREISERMRWSIANAKKYAQRIFDKLEARDRTQAVANAIRKGWL